MALSEQLRNIANQARFQADAAASAQSAQTGMQTQQAIAAGQPSKASAQQLAAGITQQQQAQQLQTAQGLQGQLLQAGQQAVQAKGFGQQMALQEREQLNATQINKMQREGALRQNSEQLRQNKQLQKLELDMQKRLASSRIEHDNRLSFLTRKQREDLANLNGYLKQQIFDNRLAFEYNAAGRRFADMRQQADYVLVSSQNQEQVAWQLGEMNRASQRSIQMLEHAHQMLTDKLTLEFQKAEKDKDQALMMDLARRKSALQKKIARKRAKRSATTSVITGVFTAVGVAVGIIASLPTAGAASPATVAMGASAGAAVGGAVGTAVSGAAESEGATI